MDTMPSTEPHHPSHMPTVLFGRGLTMGYLFVALTGCGGPSPHGRADVPVQHAHPERSADPQTPIATTNGAADPTRLAPPPAPTPAAPPADALPPLPPLPGSSGGDIVSAPAQPGHATQAPARPAPPPTTAPSGPNRLPGPADADARAPAGTANEPGTTHGLVIPGPADRSDGTPPAPPAPHGQPTPAPPIGSPINPPPTTSGGGDPGAAGAAP